MGVGAGLYVRVHDVVVKKFTFSISFLDEFRVLFSTVLVFFDSVAIFGCS